MKEKDSVSNPSQAMFDQAAIGMCQTDCHGNFVAVNAAFCRMLGRSEEELSRLTVSEITHPADVQSTRESAQRAMDSGQPFFLEKRYLRPDGSFVWSFTQVALIRDEAGKPYRFFVVAQDINDHKLAEEASRKEAEAALKQTEAALRQSEDRRTLAMEAAGIGAWVRDFEKEDVTWDDGIKRLFGLPASFQREGADVTGFLAPDDRARIDQEIARSRERGVGFDIVFPITRADGEHRMLRAIGRPRPSPNGLAMQMHGIMMDVTDVRRAAESVRESEERYRETFELAAVGMAHVDLHGKFLRVNDRLCEIAGYTREEFLNLDFIQLTHPDDLARDMEQLRALNAGKIQRYSLEKRYFHKSGRVVWIYLTVAAARNEQGETQHYISAIEDISARKESEELLRIGQERLEAALVASGTGTFRWDIKTNGLEWDQNLDRLFGLEPGKTARSLDQFIALVHPDDRAGVIQRCVACAAEGADFEMEFRVVWRDGTIRWLYDRGKTFRDAERRPSYMTGACVDITSRKQAEERLQASQERWILAQSVASAGIYDLDMITGAQTWSEENYRLFGFDPAAGAPSSEEFLQVVHEEDRHLIIDSGKAIQRGADDIDIEFRFGPVEAQRWASTRAKVFRDSSGKPLRVLGVNYDITPRKSAEDALKRAEKLAAVGRMAASIAHEINNPLEAVTNLLYLMSSDPGLSEETKMFVHEAQHQLERVAHVATQTLRFHRQSTSPALIRIGELVDSVVTLYKGRVASGNIALYRRDRGPLELMCFANDLRQVLANLIGNAIDATRDGKIVIRTRRATDWRSGRQGVMITVADTGEGMSEHTRRKIFEPFFSTKGNTGTGLGLWVTMGIVEKHQGRIKVRSSQSPRHQGTVFAVFLPFVELEAGEPPRVLHLM